MALRLRPEDGVKRHDLEAFCPRIRNDQYGKCCADALAAQAVRHACMIDDDQFVRAREKVSSPTSFETWILAISLPFEPVFSSVIMVSTWIIPRSRSNQARPRTTSDP